MASAALALTAALEHQEPGAGYNPEPGVQVLPQKAVQGFLTLLQFLLLCGWLTASETSSGCAGERQPTSNSSAYGKFPHV